MQHQLNATVLRLFTSSLVLATSVFLGTPSLAQVKVASKLFTESVILGEMAVIISRSENIEATLLKDLGGSQILFKALKKGEIDIYPEYSGTIQRELLKGQHQDWRQALKDQGILALQPFGFNNTYALAMKSEKAKKFNISTISHLINYPNLKYGFGNEFLNREDGWPGLKRLYQLNPSSVTGMQHDLAYRGLESGSIDVMDAYSTDGDIEYYNLTVLKDDQNYFPSYYGVFLIRQDTAEKYPNLVKQLGLLHSQIDDMTMTRMNAAVKIHKKSANQVAADFVSPILGKNVESSENSLWGDFITHSIDHLILSGISLLAAIIIAIPLGITATKKKSLGQVILAVVGMVQTIPSLALFVFVIPLLGIGTLPALFALFLYSLLPIVRNTYQGLTTISPQLQESAIVMGLSDQARLRLVEIPLAMSSILAGIKTAAVINIGTATLGAIIGAGGYGQPILTGIRLDDTMIILSGAIPAAGLALATQWGFELLERWLVPRGLRFGG